MTSPQDVVVATWREQSARIVGGLLRLTRDVGLAEDLAHDAMLAALEQWPATGVPDNPGAWLMTVAQRRAVDHHRRAERYARAQTRLAHELLTAREDPQVPDPAAPMDPVQDDVLRLVLVTCHPALTVESQVALTLRLVGGLTSREIARALLVPEATVVRRITRAKTALAELARSAGRDDAPFEVPPGGERERLPAVMGVVYLVFTEGYAATSGEDWVRGALCDEAVRLARLLAQLVPDEPEVHGLLALLELQGSRAAARSDADGAPVLLEDQDRSRWDQLAVRRGVESLGRALAPGPPGPYALQAAIAACHARAPSPGATDWTTVAGLYDALARQLRSPVVLVNRAVAHGMAHGPAAGLALADELADAPGLRGTHLLPSVRGDLLERLGRADEAAREFRRAAGLAATDRERDFLQRRADAAGRRTV